MARAPCSCEARILRARAGAPVKPRSRGELRDLARSSVLGVGTSILDAPLERTPLRARPPRLRAVAGRGAAAARARAPGQRGGLRVDCPPRAQRRGLLRTRRARAGARGRVARR